MTNMISNMIPGSLDLAVAQDAVQGYYAYVTDFYNNAATNAQQSLVEDTWTLLAPQIYIPVDARPTSMVEAYPAGYDTSSHCFSLAGCDEGSFVIVRILMQVDPEVDESTADLRLKFTTNTETQNTGLTEFATETQAFVMTQGADRFYSAETHLSFFVGDTLKGDTFEDAGKFAIEMNPSVDAIAEVMAVSMYVNK